MQQGLSALRVVDLSTGIPGGYCSRLLADAGADVVKVEPPGGDPWRSWSAGGATSTPTTAARCSSSCTTGCARWSGDPATPRSTTLVAGADVVVESFATVGRSTRSAWLDAHPGLVVCSITPYGRTGPYAERPTTEFIVQAESGGLVGRGSVRSVPFQAGGRTSEWLAGTFSGMAVAAAARRAQRTGPRRAHRLLDRRGDDHRRQQLRGVHAGRCSGARRSSARAARSRRRRSSRRSTGTSGSAPTAASSSTASCCSSSVPISSTTIRASNQMRPPEAAGTSGTRSSTRGRRSTRPPRSCSCASELRIPVAPVHSGENILDCDHFVARDVFVDDPSGTFKMPRRPWRMDDEDPPPPRPAPRLGEHTGTIEARTRRRARAVAGDAELPLAGRARARPHRMVGGPDRGRHARRARRRRDPRRVDQPDRRHARHRREHGHGRRVVGAQRALPVLEHQQARPHPRPRHRRRPRAAAPADRRERRGARELLAARARQLRARLGADPARSTRGASSCACPRSGCRARGATTSGSRRRWSRSPGMAWITGHRDDQPRIQQGPSDPNAGMHAAFALIVGLAEREATGRGCLLEVTMVEGALNAACRAGARDDRVRQPARTRRQPQPERRAAGPVPRARATRRGWRSRSRPTTQWQALVDALGRPEWATDPELATLRRPARPPRRARRAPRRSGRRAATPTRRPSCSSRTACPPRSARDPRSMYDHPQLRARGFYEEIDHPVVGAPAHPDGAVPVRVGRPVAAHRRRRPSASTTTRSSSTISGIDEDTYQRLVDTSIIGDRPLGV